MTTSSPSVSTGSTAPVVDSWSTVSRSQSIGNVGEEPLRPAIEDDNESSVFCCIRSATCGFLAPLLFVLQRATKGLPAEVPASILMGCYIIFSACVYIYIIPFVPSMLMSKGVFVLCNVGVLFFYSLVLILGPGKVSISPLRSQELIRQGVHGKFCSFCKILQPSRTVHCNSCQQCIPKFDHHCLLTNSCIGYRNHFHFIMMLTCLSFVVFATVWLCCWHIYFSSNAPSFQLSFTYIKELWRVFPVDMVLIFCSILVHILLWPLRSDQMLFITHGITTHEYLQSQSFRSPYNRGMLDNWLEFCGIRRGTDWSSVEKFWEPDVDRLLHQL